MPTGDRPATTERAMKGNSFNLCNVAPWVLASHEFNERPRALEIQGVRRSNRFLLEKLASIEDPRLRGEIFHDYMSVKFYLHQWELETEAARRSIKNSYVRFLRGWGFDSNSIEGAVLKGWVESRFGLVPTFHKHVIAAVYDEHYMVYADDRMRGSARTNAILSQLDVLYEYAQFELRRRPEPEPWLTLYRGTNDDAELEVLERSGRNLLVRLNNLSSFTSNRERAWEFGSTVWEVRVPTSKVFYYHGLLPGSILQGEDEYLVLGCEYRVRQLLH